MAEACIVKSGETVEVTDPRLGDTGCTIEPGVIVRPPADLSTDVDPDKEPAPKPKKAKVDAKSVANVAAPENIKEKNEAAWIQPERKSLTSMEETTVAQPEPVQKEIDMQLDPATIMSIVAGLVAATVTVGFSGGSSLQSRASSFFGSSKTVAAATAATAGTIVAVKVLESRMKNLESDLSKARKAVDETAETAKRIDALLDRIGS